MWFKLKNELSMIRKRDYLGTSDYMKREKYNSMRITKWKIWMVKML